MAQRKLEYKITADVSEALKSFNKMEKKVERFGRNMRNTGRDIAALTAPFAALGAIGVKEALEFERSFAKIRAGTGATGDALKGLVKDFEAVNKQVSQGDEVVAQALADVNTRLGLTGSALQETTKSFMDLSRIMGVDSSQLITSATQAMNNWGVSANEATSFLDKLYTASYTMGIGVNELAAQVSGTGATFRNMGLSIEETIALIASFEKAGLNAGAMIMPLNTAMAKLQKEGVKDLGAGLNSVIASIKNAKTNSEAMGIAVEYFGRRGAALGSAIREGRFEIDALVDSLKNSNGQLSKAAIDTMTAGESFKLLKKNAEDALEPVGKELMKLALDYAPKAQKAIEWLGSESGLQTIKIGLITTAVSGVIAILGDLVIKIGAVSKALLALGSNPYFWVITTGLAIGAGAAKLEKKIKSNKVMLAAVRTKEPEWKSYNAKTGKGETVEQAYNRLFPGYDDVKPVDMQAFNAKRLAEKETKTTSPKTTTPTLKLPTGGSGSSKKTKADTTDWTAKLADAQLAFNNATGANDAAKKMDIYAAALAKVSLTAGDAKAKTEAYNEATRLTGEFGSALAERIREVEDAFEANGSINEAQSALNAIGEKYKLTAAQAKMLTDSLSELTKKAAENEKELQKKADEDKLTRAENLYNAETAFGGQASVETARQYIAVLEEMRSKVEVGSTAWQTLGEKIRKVNEDAMDLNLKNITKELNSCQTEVQGLASKFAIGLSDAFGQAAVGAADLGESISSLLQSFGQLIVKTMALNALKATFKGITGGGWDFSGILGGIFHDGGIVGQTASPMRAVSASVFANAPRLHTGNLRADEYPAILQRGEGVLSRKQMANLGRGGDSNAVTVNVTVNNSGGGDMTNEQAQNLGNMINKAVEVKVAETMYKFGRGRMGVAF